MISSRSGRYQLLVSSQPFRFCLLSIWQPLPTTQPPIKWWAVAVALRCDLQLNDLVSAIIPNLQCPCQPPERPCPCIGPRFNLLLCLVRGSRCHWPPTQPPEEEPAFTETQPPLLYPPGRTSLPNYSASGETMPLSSAFCWTSREVLPWVTPFGTISLVNPAFEPSILSVSFLLLQLCTCPVICLFACDP